MNADWKRQLLPSKRTGVVAIPAAAKCYFLWSEDFFFQVTKTRLPLLPALLSCITLGYCVVFQNFSHWGNRKLQRPWADTQRESVTVDCSFKQIWQRESRSRERQADVRMVHYIWSTGNLIWLRWHELLGGPSQHWVSNVGKVHNRVLVPCHYGLSSEQGWWKGTSLISPCQQNDILITCFW